MVNSEFAAFVSGEPFQKTAIHVAQIGSDRCGWGAKFTPLDPDVMLPHVKIWLTLEHGISF
jgi:hypothetical protein